MFAKITLIGRIELAKEEKGCSNVMNVTNYVLKTNLIGHIELAKHLSQTFAYPAYHISS